MLLFKLTGKIIAALLTISLMLVSPASAKSVADWVGEGNQAFDVQAFDAAISAYDKALSENPGDARILYNKACALYMNKDYAGARDLFEKAALKANDAVFEAKTHFNMGNAEFKNSTNSRDTDLKNTIEGVERSIAHYEKALALNPEMTDAAHNLEMARMTLQKIQEQLQQQKQAAEKQQKQQQEKEGQNQNKRQKQTDAGQGENSSDAPQNNAAPQHKAQNADNQDQEPSALKRTEDPEKILEEENQNRRRRQIQKDGNYRPVEKDW